MDAIPACEGRPRVPLVVVLAGKSSGPVQPFSLVSTACMTLVASDCRAKSMTGRQVLHWPPMRVPALVASLGSHWPSCYHSHLRSAKAGCIHPQDRPNRLPWLPPPGCCTCHRIQCRPCRGSRRPLAATRRASTKHVVSLPVGQPLVPFVDTDTGNQDLEGQIRPGEWQAWQKIEMEP